MLKAASLLLGLFLSCSAFSQNSTIHGNVADTGQHKGIANAVVALLSPGDSVLYKFARTDAQGHYSFTNVKPGKYILMTTHPYFADFLDDIEVKENSTVLPAVALTSRTKLLQEVIVKSGAPIRIKGDTTIYTADSFKVSANANVEELLKKLPGIQVDKSGKITAMGEQVTKVLVDGEEFFGDDPGMAVKNLRADAVKEVQVFDKKSDQAEFTGVDDGNTQKTINLKLKEDRKKGYFGKIDLAGGLQKHIDNRYNTNILLASFKGKRKITGFLLTGNTGQDGLNWQDEEKYMGGNENFSMNMDESGDVSFMWTGGTTSDGEPNINTENGFIKNINAGLQYSNKWNNRQTLNLTPKYNSQVYSNNMRRYSRAVYGDSAIVTNGNTSTHVNRYNYKNNGSLDLFLDSSNSLKFTFKANFYNTKSSETQSSNATGDNGTPKNFSYRETRNSSDKQSLMGNLLFRHKFKKARRTLSFNAEWDLLTTDANNFLLSDNDAYYNGVLSSSQHIDQQKKSETSSRLLTGKLVYTEPLGKKYSLEINYELSSTLGKTNQLTHSYSPLTHAYDVSVDSLTNDFTQSALINKPGIRLNYSTKKIKFNLGSVFGITHLDLRDNTLNKDYIRNYVNYFPSVSFNYAYKNQHNLRIYYNGNTRQPTISQLQPLRNNNDYFNQYLGNPSLDPAFTHSFGISHNAYNFLKDQFTYASLNARFTSKAITNSQVVNLDSGKTVTRPVNTNGNYSVNFYGGTGMKLKKLDMRINIGPQFSYNRYADVYNGLKTFSKVLALGFNIYLNKSKEKKYELSLYNDFTYNNNKNSRSSSVSHFINNNLGFEGTLYFTKSFSLNSDVHYLYVQPNYDGGKKINVTTWNAKLQKTFRKDEFTLYCLVRDILNQNQGVDTDFDRNTYTETYNDRLKRYWMVGLTWNFKNKGAAAAK
ncbi:MAG: TonB dependent receptor [Ferruginibacter sp.]